MSQTLTTVTTTGESTSISPAHWLDLSRVHYQSGQYEQALMLCQNVLQLDVGQALAWNNGAAALASLGRWVDAFAYAKQAIALSPKAPEVVSNVARIMANLGQVGEAGMLLRNLGWENYQSKQIDTAQGLYETAMQLNAHDVDALHVLAGLHSERKNKTLALELMNRALGIDPHHLVTLAAKGNLIGSEFAQFEEAEACFLTALSVNPNHWMTLYNYGVFLAGQERYPEAISMYERAGQADPNNHLAFWNLSNLLLRLGDYPRAWPLYEWRWKTDHLKPAYLTFNVPLWTGQDLQGKRILLHFEQGYGDAFQFIRFAKTIADLGAFVVLFMPKEICDNFIGCAGVGHITPWHTPIPLVDYHAPLMSLPAPLGLTIHNIPSQVPYLFAQADRLTTWQAKLPALDPVKKQKLRVGIAWCGRPTHDNDKNRSMAFSEWLPLIEAFPQIQFISMQVGPREGDLAALGACQNIVRVESDIQDFSDTAALAMQLDLLISVDTSVVHLTAALGKPVWAIIPATSDWRWLLDEGETQETTPWYPNVRLFRQSKEDGKTWNWTNVLKRLQETLRLQTLALSPPALQN